MDDYDIKKSQVQNVDKIVEYVPNSVVIKSIINKPTGSVCAVALDSGEVLNGKIVPFDTFIQIIDGKAEILIDDNSNLLKSGQSIIIPAHSRNSTKANVKFKMLSTTIKSAYEEDG
jgi:quercetin dioxygenase-like cupin family protein